MYLNVFHSDIEDFLQTKKLNADDDIRVKTLSMGVVIPDKMIELAKDTVLIELEGIVVEEDCEYLIQIESYGRRVYAQEQLTSLLSLGLKSYVEKTFSSKQPTKPLFRVMSGPYLNKSEVNNARELLIKNNRQPLIYKKCTKN